MEDTSSSTPQKNQWETLAPQLQRLGLGQTIRLITELPSGARISLQFQRDESGRVTCDTRTRFGVGETEQQLKAAGEYYDALLSEARTQLPQHGVEITFVNEQPERKEGAAAVSGEGRMR